MTTLEAHGMTASELRHEARIFFPFVTHHWTANLRALEVGGGFLFDPLHIDTVCGAVQRFHRQTTLRFKRRGGSIERIA